MAITKPYWINAGCGYDLKQGMLNVDILEKPKNSIMADYLQGSAVHLFDLVARGPEGTGWDGIEAIYLVEHVDVEDIHTMFYNWNLCLRVGGIVRIVVPSLDAAIEEYSKDRSYSMFRKLIYEMMGGPKETGVSPHTALWNLDWLSLFLRAEGFQVTSHKDSWGSHRLGLYVQAQKIHPCNATEEWKEAWR